MYAVGKVFGRLILSYVAIVQVVYHLRNASGVEAYARYTARHRFGYGVRQILHKRRSNKQVDGIVYLGYLFLVRHIVYAIDWVGELVGILLRFASYHHYAYGLGEIGILLSKQAASLNQIVDTFPFVGNLHGAEKKQLLIGRQIQLFAYG